MAVKFLSTKSKIEIKNWKDKMKGVPNVKA